MTTIVSSETLIYKDGSFGTAVKHVIPSGEVGPWIPVAKRFTVTAIPSGSGKIQYTTSFDSAVNANTAAAEDWSRGTVTSACSDSPEGPVTAIRGVSVSGSLTVEVVT